MDRVHVQHLPSGKSQISKPKMTSSFILVCGDQTSSCGYCHSAKEKESSSSFGIWSYTLDPEDYQTLLDYGWRRSGHYLYLPNNPKTCCPAFTIKCRANEFQVRGSSKKVLKKMKKEAMGTGQRSSTAPQLSLEQLIQDAEGGSVSVTLEKACFDAESFALYKKYQMAVHQDTEEELTEIKYRRFLVESPLRYTKPSTFAKDEDQSIPIEYGSYHQKYCLNGRLIAVGVIDLLPKCVSSVYFIWDPDMAHLSLGVYSALKEIALTRKLNLLLPELQYYYLGLYIHSCPKMTYKAAYAPCDLLCPVNHVWVPFDDAKALLDTGSAGPLKEVTTCPVTENIYVNDPSRIAAFLDGSVIPLSVHPSYPNSAENISKFLQLFPPGADFIFVS